MNTTQPLPINWTATMPELPRRPAPVATDLVAAKAVTQRIDFNLAAELAKWSAL